MIHEVEEIIKEIDSFKTNLTPAWATVRPRLASDSKPRAMAVFFCMVLPLVVCVFSTISHILQFFWVVVLKECYTTKKPVNKS